MDRGPPTSALGLLSRPAGVVLPSPVNEVYRAIGAAGPCKRRNCVDDRSEIVKRVSNFAKHRFAGFWGAHIGSGPRFSHALAGIRYRPPQFAMLGESYRSESE